MNESDEFLGNTPVIFDDKGRFNVPSSIKSILNDKYNPNLIICVKKDHIMIFPKKEWDESKKDWAKLNPFSDDDGQLKEKRQALSNTSYYQMKSGKILIPMDQRKKVGLGKEAVLNGMSNYFEVWPKELWEKDYG